MSIADNGRGGADTAKGSGLAGLQKRLEAVDGRLTNRGIAKRLVVTEGAVEKHVQRIFTKLDLHADGDEHRRVAAVLAFLRSS